MVPAGKLRPNFVRANSVWVIFESGEKLDGVKNTPRTLQKQLNEEKANCGSPSSSHGHKQEHLALIKSFRDVFSEESCRCKIGQHKRVVKPN